MENIKIGELSYEKKEIYNYGNITDITNINLSNNICYKESKSLYEKG